ncbi:MAG: MerR family transcriptional regulator [Kangiellaceae bacterium]|nr:MerR family transcriptional regulator [Kangiellaceae bacterium]
MTRLLDQSPRLLFGKFMRLVMLTVSQLAKKFNISRATIFYYERKGILLSKLRSENGYRWYGEQEVKRLELIISYRSFGLPVAKLTELIERNDEIVQQRILRDQFSTLEKEILRLRLQQKTVVQLLKQPQLLENKMVTKERWTEIMREAGLTDEDMLNWHRKFESMEPGEHQLFLESLGIQEGEIKRIRAF